MDMAMAVAGALLALVGSLMLVAAAFRTSPGWGLATLLIPGAFVLFVFAHWREARNGFLTLLIAATLIFTSGVTDRLGSGAAPAADRRSEPAASSPGVSQEAAPAPAPPSSPPNPQPSPGVRWVGQARDAASAQQQRDGASGLP